MAQISYSVFIVLMILVTVLTYGFLWWLFFRNPYMSTSLEQPVLNATSTVAISPPTTGTPTSTAMTPQTVLDHNSNDDTSSHDG